MSKIIYLNLVLFYYMNSCSFAIDSHDFLNANYLPYTLMLETSLLDNDNSSTTDDNTTANGDMSNALNTMRYHRTMINEYLCHNFVAKEILEEFGLQGYAAEDRSGIAAEKVNKKSPPADKNELLDDVGLDSYKKWLAKSAILSDIYKHYDVEENDGGSQIYASGEVTGYAIQTDETTTKLNNEETESKNNRGLYKLSHHQSSGLVDSAASNPEIDVYNPHYNFDTSQHGYTFTGHSSTGSGYGGTDHYHHTPSYQTHHTIPTHHHVEEEKGLALKDLFDLALTALAFLGFGLFVINIIMTCFAAQQGTTVVMQMTTDGGTGTPGSDGTIRVKRDTSTIKINELNRLSYHVLSSIDSLIMLQHDKEQEHCLKRSLCESNKFSRFLPLNQQMWVPIWSFGVSWISGKLLHQELRIENLRAVLLGLGKANCKTVYRKCKILNETIKT